MVMQLNQCCCGCTLKTGSLIIGILCALGSLCSLISAVVNADAYAIYDTNTTESEADGLRGIFIFMAVLYAFMLVVNILLIMGAVQERASYLFPWVIAYTVLSAINAIMYVVIAIMCFAIASGAGVGLGVGILIGGSVGICLYAYCILVVYSYYRTLTGSMPGTA